MSTLAGERSRGRNIKALWIDDEPGSVKALARELDKQGFEVTVVSPDEQIIDNEVQTSDVVLLDLRWLQGERKKFRYPDAKRLAQSVTASRPEMPIVLVSNFFADEEFLDIEREIAPTARVARVDKSSLPSGGGRRDIKRSMNIDILTERIESVLPSDLRTSESPKAADDQQRAEIERIFAMTPLAYQNLSPKERVNLVRDATLQVQPLVDETFESSDVDWIVVGGQPPAVLLWGYRADEPRDEQLWELASHHGFMPFIIMRPAPVDSIVGGNFSGDTPSPDVPGPSTKDASVDDSSEEESAGSGLGWAQCKGAYDYPLLLIDFEGDADDDFVPILFDTGAGANYVSEEFLESLGVELELSLYRSIERNVGVPTKDLSPVARAALKIFYSDRELSLTVSDGSGSHSGSVRFRAVADWDASTLSSRCEFGGCPNSVELSTNSYECGVRKALMSGSALKDLGLGVLIDGVSRTVQLMDKTPA